MRERYGYHLFGQSALVARRLVEAGTRLVTVFWDEFGQSCGAWDTHEQAEKRLKTELCPGLDQTFSALWKTWMRAGCWTKRWWSAWASTAAPRSRRSATAWPMAAITGRGAYSGLFAGCGIARGAVVGQSDAEAGLGPGSPGQPQGRAADDLSPDGRRCRSPAARPPEPPAAHRRRRRSRLRNARAGVAAAYPTLLAAGIAGHRHGCCWISNSVRASALRRKTSSFFDVCFSIQGTAFSYHFRASS